MLLYETHAHVAPSSGCAKVYKEEAVRLIKFAGYDGFVLTNHLTGSQVAEAGDWDSAVEQYLERFESVRSCAEEHQLHALLGAELNNFETKNDYLMYGLMPDFLRACGNLVARPLKETRAICAEAGVLLIQAHPFRNHMTVVPPAWLDGYEVENGNPRHDSRNDIARAWHARVGGIATSGSDFHQIGDEKRGGVYLPRRPADEIDFAALLRAGTFERL